MGYGPRLADRVKDTSTTTGTGTLTLANSAPTGFQTFGSAFANGDTVFYTIAHQSAAEWESGIGTYTSSGTTLARNRVLSGSSGAGTKVSFSAGTKDVFVSPLASQYEWLPKIVPPVLSDFTAFNSGSATQTRGGIYLAATAGAGGANYKGYVKTAPATPYTITALIASQVGWTSGGSKYTAFGVVFRQSSDGKLVATSYYPNTAGSSEIDIENMNDPTSMSSRPLSALASPVGVGLAWFQIADDGTNRYHRLSPDGVNWIEVYNVGRTSFLTADQVGFAVNPYNMGVGITLLSWEEA